MNKILLKLKNNKRLVLFLTSLFFIGFTAGILFYYFQNEGMKEVLKTSISLKDLSNSKINNIIPHLIILSSLIILSVFIIGVPLSLFYLFYESFSLGFTMITLTTSLKTTGIIFFLKYIIIFKLFTIILLIIYNTYIIKILKNIISLTIYKEQIYKRKLILNIKKISIYFIFTIILDIIIYFISPVILKYLF